MAEIRVRDASPKLIEQLQIIAKEVREATVAGTIEKMIPRYHDMKKRITEQNTEIAKISNDLRTLQFKFSNIQQDIKGGLTVLLDMRKEIDHSVNILTKQLQTFGTKKKPAARRPGARSGKNVPKKKPINKPKKNKK